MIDILTPSDIVSVPRVIFVLAAGFISFNRLPFRFACQQNRGLTTRIGPKENEGAVAKTSRLLCRGRTGH